MGGSVSKDVIQTSTLTDNQLLALIQDQRIKERSKNIPEYINYEAERKELGLWNSGFEEAVKNFLHYQLSNFYFKPSYSSVKNLFYISETLMF
jgi:hypothetical protein